ncbi:hypothetical protein SXCC_04270 [Gluconacetobacter sp. SXCC-1]|nr:hypothetical protein SXCC_04270 [Gluconacetobacter sp. SXCC-1]
MTAAPSFLAKQENSVPPSSAALRSLRDAPPLASVCPIAIEAAMVRT